MPSKITEATLEFQAKASRMLLSESPAVSGYLQSSHQTLADVHDNGERPRLPDPYCAACGSALIPGWTCTLQHGKGGNVKRTRQARLNDQSDTKTMSLECSACSATTRIEAKKRPRQGRSSYDRRATISNKAAPSAAVDPVSSGPTTTAKLSDSRSVSKKRGRNKKSSLQSMLDDRKLPAAKKGFGLDLMDFMNS